MRSSYKRIGDYIRLVDQRNSDEKVTTLLGLSIDKTFIPSVANIIGSDMENYKIIRKGQFACSLMQVRRDKKIPVALLTEPAEAIISPVYPVFEIIDTAKLLPDYLMMWMRRSEFDREACFHAVGGVRGSLEWDDFCNLRLPVPSIDQQQKIVTEYQVIVDRIKLSEQLIQKLEETAQAIFKHWFVDFEFPMSEEYAASIGRPDLEGKPYKSNGGEMEQNVENSTKLPKDWYFKELKQMGKVKGGKRLPAGDNLTSVPTIHPYIKVADMGIFKFICLSNNFEYISIKTHRKISKYIVEKGDLIISIVGTIGKIKIIDNSLDKANLTENCAKICELKNINADYIYHFLCTKEGFEEIEMRTVGGVQGKLPLYNIGSIKIPVPEKQTLQKFIKVINGINKKILNKQMESIHLSHMTDIFLARLSTLS